MAKIIDKMKNIFSDDDDLDYDEYEGDGTAIFGKRNYNK